MQDVSRLEKATAEARELPSAPPDDIRALLVQLRAGMERELFRIAQRKSHGESVLTFVSLAHTLRELKNADAIPKPLAAAIEEFADIYDRLASDSQLSNRTKNRISTIAERLSAQLHRYRLILEMEYEFASHGLWHMHRDKEGPAKRYFWWSALAESCQKFEHDYDVYRLAAEQHNNRLLEKMSYEAAKRGLIEIIPLADYIEVLRFRESEIRRVLAAYKAAGQTGFHDADKWQWPPEWDVQWGGPVVKGYLWDAEQALMETQLAIRRYQAASTRNV